MDQLVIRALRQDDCARLLEFESAQRAWFERNIEARDEDFYCMAGVAAHIDGFLAAQARGERLPCVGLDENGRIVARGNLKDIDRAAGTAEIGYRVGENATGKGIASAMLRHLVALARTELGLSALTAVITVKNAASARVLEKGGFVRRAGRTNVAIVQGRWVDGFEYVLML
jgi:ribosomal-protein-alanine N-acetyltransferase